jgi:hypothetical protein
MLDHMEIGVREIAGARAFYCACPRQTQCRSRLPLRRNDHATIFEPGHYRDVVRP